MIRRRSQGTVFANPVLVGAITLLVVNVATVLGWFANRGLPFVPTQQVKIEMTNGANLLPGNEVREGGFRIGIVNSMKPIPLRDGKVGAIATLKIDKKQADIPVDSTAVIRPRSVLGLKYVQFEKGKSKEMLQDGDTIPLGRTRIPVDLDEFQNIFDEKTRAGARRNLRGFGEAFAQRGASINKTIQEAPRFLEHLEPVAEILSRKDTNLPRFFGELGDFVRIVKPVADRYSHGFTAGADTFEAWSRDPQALKDTIEKSGPTMAVGIDSFRKQRPFLVAFRDFSAQLDRTARQLPRTLPRIVPALEEGIPVLKRSPQINEELEKTFVTLQDLMESPGTGASFRALGDTVNILNPAVRYVGPYITVCNYFNYSWTHVAEHLAETDATGGSQRTLLNQGGNMTDNEFPGQRTSVGSGGAITPANGGTPVPPTAPQQFLHSNNYSAAVDDNGNADCESGQRGYISKQSKYWPENYKIVVDPHLPGNSGTTFSGRAKVPAGQTFDRHPKIGPEFPAALEVK
jgi:virulence factor Mce-like protein